MRLKLQQLTGSQQQARLKQSNSDNFLNQPLTLDANSNWSHSRAPQYQAAYCTGTLPRNPASGQLNQANQPQVFLDSSYGHLKVTGEPMGALSSALMLAPAAGSHHTGPVPVEHLLISGKQYIHQTRPLPGVEPTPVGAQTQRHLQLTGATVGAPFQQPAQLYPVRANYYQAGGQPAAGEW